jgi:hypothetical protein
VIDAADAVDRDVLEVLLVERDESFDLTARHLVALSDANVDQRLIDLMIGLSFPDRFVIDRQAQNVSELPGTAPANYGYDRDRYGRDWTLYDPFYGPYGYGYGYNRRGYGYYGYDPYRYSPFGGYGYGYGYGTRGGGPIIIVRPNQPDTGYSPSRGRMVNGRGYVGSGTASGTAQRSSSGSSTAASSSSSSSGSSASSRSGSRSSSSTGRTAKKRGGG